jgi:hypothetical protein
MPRILCQAKLLIKCERRIKILLIIIAVERLRQEFQKFENSLGYIVSLSVKRKKERKDVFKRIRNCFSGSY